MFTFEGVAGWALGPVAVRGGDAGGLVPTHEPEGGSPESEPCALANRQLGSALEHLLIYLVPEHVCYLKKKQVKSVRTRIHFSIRDFSQ